MQLEMDQMDEVDGKTFDECVKILRHELGHALDNAYRLRKNKQRQQLFGSSKKQYPVSYLPSPYSRNFVLHLNANYAQSHPDEDFAETFAVWLSSKRSWKRRYKAWPVVLNKLHCIDSLMSEIAKKKPLLTNKYRPDRISLMKMTLGQYYRQKRKKLGLTRTNSLDNELKTIFTTYPLSNGLSAKSFIKKNRSEARKLVAKGLGEYQYRVDRVIIDLERRASQLNLHMKQSTDKTKREFLNLLIEKSIEYNVNGYHRVIL